jgi:hypothetical protein
VTALLDTPSWGVTRSGVAVRVGWWLYADANGGVCAMSPNVMEDDFEPAGECFEPVTVD